MTRIERFIEKWPESFSRDVKITLRRFHAREISRKTATELLHREIEAALNNVALTTK
jgi:hypothetical protein